MPYLGIMSVPEEHRNYGTTLPKHEKGAEDGTVVDDRSLSESSDEDASATAGVKAIEAISKAWSGWWLFVAYFG